MYLAIEIGGTKLQLAVGPGGRAPLIDLRRMDVVAADGARGILRQIERAAPDLIADHRIQAIGVGFGGPVERDSSAERKSLTERVKPGELTGRVEPGEPGRVSAGRVVKSHHVAGWEGFPMGQWCREKFGLPTAVGNDCDVAALAEATVGAGRGKDPVFYVTVGTGIGGGLVVGGRIYQGHGNAAAEIGHLRFGLDAAGPEQNLESLASGWGIAARGRESISCGQAGKPSPSASSARDPLPTPSRDAAADLLARCAGQLDHLTGRHVADAAAAGNVLAREVLAQATTALGWAIAQVITLVSPEIVVIGGGVSLIGEELFFAPVRQAAACYGFPPLEGSYEIVPAQLGEEVVLHGALALAALAE